MLEEALISDIIEALNNEKKSAGWNDNSIIVLIR
jgi:hypothetical protein